MIFRQIFESVSSTYTYLIASGKGREAVIIDPVFEKIPIYSKLIKELDLKLVVSIDTHIHADHITASGRLEKAYDDCRIVMGEAAKVEFDTYKVKEGDCLDIDGLKFNILYTPGHTDDSYSFCMKDRVFTGDTLLIKGTGRTDFQNGSASQQYDSIFNKLLRLPKETLVYPAHDYNGMAVSTIEEEEQFNPRLQVTSEKEYVSIMNALKLQNPRMMDIAVPANKTCGLLFDKN